MKKRLQSYQSSHILLKRKWKLSPEDVERLLENIRELAHQRLPGVKLNATELTRIFGLGIEVAGEEIQSERMDVAIETYLRTKLDLRPSSLTECRGVLHRLLREVEGLGERTVRSMQPKDCLDAILQVYQTPHTIDKARRLMNCFFNFAIQQNWCRDNPMRRMRVCRRVERTVEALALSQVHELLRAAARPEFQCCAAAVGIMLWAGIRPAEVGRLHWCDVDFDEQVITVVPVVSKTGGARVVTIQPVLLRWLNRWRSACGGDNPQARVVPGSWVHRWKHLRRMAGLEPWRPDTLRHTFASYHLRYFRDLHQLQLEMGHSSAKLLFSRYLNQAGITRESAAAFWGRSTPLPRQKRMRKKRGLTEPVHDLIELNPDSIKETAPDEHSESAT